MLHSINVAHQVLASRSYHHWWAFEGCPPAAHMPRHRCIHPAHRVLPGSLPNQRDTFHDLNQWYSVLRRPPQTWSVHEAATWAWMPDEHGGAQLPWLAQLLVDNCIDGHLLLTTSLDQLNYVLVRGREDARKEQLQQAIADLRHLTEGIAAGEVLVPISVVPPQPDAPTTRELLLQGKLPPRRKKKLPWDRDGISNCAPRQLDGNDIQTSTPQPDQAVAQGANAANAGKLCSTGLGYNVRVPAPSTAQSQVVPKAGNHVVQPWSAQPAQLHVTADGRRVSLSQKEAILAAAAAAARTLANTDTSARAVQSALTAVSSAVAPATGRQAGSVSTHQVAAPAQLQHETLDQLSDHNLGHRADPDKTLAVQLEQLAGSRAEYVRLAQHYKGLHKGVRRASYSVTLPEHTDEPVCTSQDALHMPTGTAPVHTTLQVTAAHSPTQASPARLPASLSNLGPGTHGLTQHAPQTISDTIPAVPSAAAAPRAAQPTVQQTFSSPERVSQPSLATPKPTLCPLQPVAAKEMQPPDGPYRQTVVPYPMPDVYHTRDLQHVHKVLEQGRRQMVRHTLKSQLCEDLVRGVRGLAPRDAGPTGLSEAQGPAKKLEVADREVALRLAAGLPVSSALYLNTLEAGPRARDIVKVLALNKPVPTPPSAPAQPQSPSSLAARPMSAPSTTRADPASVHAMTASLARPHSSRAASTQPVAHPARKPAVKHGQLKPRYAFPRQDRTVKQKHGRRPAWDLNPILPYPLPGFAPTLAGGPMTQDQARALADRVHGRDKAGAGGTARQPTTGCWMTDLLTTLRSNCTAERVAQQLAKHHMEVNTYNATGLTLLHMAITWLHRNSMGGGHPKHMIKTLLEMGADPRLPVNDGTNRHVLHLLLDDMVAGVVLHASDRINHVKLATNTGRQAPCSDLMWAARLLMSYGADPLAADVHAVTPLHMAAVTGSKPLVHMLLQQACRLTQTQCPMPRDVNGRTPLSLAKEYKHASVVEVLEASEQQVNAQHQSQPTAVQPAAKQAPPEPQASLGVSSAGVPKGGKAALAAQQVQLLREQHPELVEQQ